MKLEPHLFFSGKPHNSFLFNFRALPLMPGPNLLDLSCEEPTAVNGEGMEVAGGGASEVHGGLDILADIFSTPAPPSTTSHLEPSGMYVRGYTHVLYDCESSTSTRVLF